jgi:hypothetical protein
MPTHDVYAQMKAVDTIHQEVVEGEFEVVGAEGNGKLFIQHGGRLREVSLTGHLRPEGVRIRPGAPHRIVEQQVEMRGRLFREIAPFVDGERVYLFGSFRLATDRDPRQRVDALNPVRRFGDLLRLEYASLRDLEEQGLLVAPIEDGTLLLKFILLPEAPVRPVSLGETAGAVQTLQLKRKSLDELSTGLNGEVRQGAPLARSREAERELVQINEEMATEEEQEAARERLFRQRKAGWRERSSGRSKSAGGARGRWPPMRRRAPPGFLPRS